MIIYPNPIRKVRRIYVKRWKIDIFLQLLRIWIWRINENRNLLWHLKRFVGFSLEFKTVKTAKKKEHCKIYSDSLRIISQQKISALPTQAFNLASIFLIGALSIPLNKCSGETFNIMTKKKMLRCFIQHLREAVGSSLKFKQKNQTIKSSVKSLMNFHEKCSKCFKSLTSFS